MNTEQHLRTLENSIFLPPAVLMTATGAIYEANIRAAAQNVASSDEACRTVDRTVTQGRKITVPPTADTARI